MVRQPQALAGLVVGIVVLILAAYFPRKHESRAATLADAYAIAVERLVQRWQPFAVNHQLPGPAHWDWKTCQSGDDTIVVATIPAAIPLIVYATIVQSKLPLGGLRVRVGDGSTPPAEACEPLDPGGVSGLFFSSLMASLMSINSTILTIQ